MSRFFIVVREATLQEGKLNVPPNFVKKNARTMNDRIVLNVRNGDRWIVRLEKDRDGKAWFAWKGFQRRYSIKDGHLLLFNYQGNSIFQVAIFNKTALEISYPSNATQSDSESGSDSEELDQSLENCMDKGIAIQGAEAFESEYPSFWICLTPAYISKCFMTVPQGFIREHLEKESTEVLLENSEGRSWRVVYVYMFTGGRTYGRFTRNWKVFVKENNLKVDDVCVFELIRRTKPVYFRFQIFRTRP